MTGPRRAGRRRSARRASTAVLALLPFALFAAALTVYPFAQVVRMSFSEIKLTATGFHFSWNGVVNYVDVLGNKDSWQATGNTAVFIIATVAGSLSVGLVLALLVNRSVLLLPVARNVMIWPAVIAPVVVSLMWLLILSPTAGGLNKLLGTLGIGEQKWLDSGHGAMASLVLVDIWHWTPIVFLFIYTALQGISVDVLEAARIDGAGERQILSRIVLPLLMPAIGAVALVRVIMGVKVFDEMYLLTQGGPAGATTLVSQRVQLWFFQDLKYGQASAFSLLVVVLTAVALAAFMLTRHLIRGKKA